MIDFEQAEKSLARMRAISRKLDKLDNRISVIESKLDELFKDSLTLDVKDLREVFSE